MVLRRRGGLNRPSTSEPRKVVNQTAIRSTDAVRNGTNSETNGSAGHQQHQHQPRASTSSVIINSGSSTAAPSTSRPSVTEPVHPQPRPSILEQQSDMHNNGFGGETRPQQTVRHRESSPSKVFRIWTAVQRIMGRGVLPIFRNVQASLVTEFSMKPEDVSHQIELAIKDGLIEQATPDSSLEIPPLRNLEARMQDHDMYCYKCHRPGDLQVCARMECRRVYCFECLPQFTNGSCETCVTSDRSVNELIRDRRATTDEVSQLLVFAFKRMIRVDPTIRSCLLPREKGQEQQTHQLMRALLRIPTTVHVIDKKINEKQYVCIGDFEQDLNNLIHNVHIIYGEGSTQAKAVKAATQRAFTETAQMRDCIDCYLTYYQKSMSDVFYFILPCDPPHEIVYAKIKGNPYWPAKVIRKERERAYVRFFGVKHETAFVKFSDILDITKPIKENPGFVPLKSAMEEFKKHRDLLANHRPLPIQPPITSWETLADRKSKTMLNRMNQSSSTRGGLSASSSRSDVIPPTAAVRGGRGRGRGRGGRGGGRGGHQPSIESNISRREHLLRECDIANVTTVEANGMSIEIAELNTGDETDSQGSYQTTSRPGTSNSNGHLALPPKKRLTIDNVVNVSNEWDDDGRRRDHAYNKRHQVERATEDIASIPDVDVSPHGRKRLRSDAYDHDSSFVRRSDRVRRRTERYIEELNMKREYDEDELDVSPDRHQHQQQSPVFNNGGGFHQQRQQSARKSMPSSSRSRTPVPSPVRVKAEPFNSYADEEIPINPVTGRPLRGPGSRGGKTYKGKPGTTRGGYLNRGYARVKEEERVVEDDIRGRRLPQNDYTRYTATGAETASRLIIKPERHVDQVSPTRPTNYTPRTYGRQPMPSTITAPPFINHRQFKVESNQPAQSVPDLDVIPRRQHDSIVRSLNTRIETMQADLERAVEETKRKHWCASCLNQAIYYCCWQTSYCSQQCQMRHWRAAHKSSCRRKEGNRQSTGGQQQQQQVVVQVGVTTNAAPSTSKE